MNISFNHCTPDNRGVIKFLFNSGVVSISTTTIPSIAIFNSLNHNITQNYKMGLNYIYNPTAQDISSILNWAEANLNSPTREEMLKELSEINDRRNELVDLVEKHDQYYKQRARGAGWYIEEHGAFKGYWVNPETELHYEFVAVIEHFNGK